MDCSYAVKLQAQNFPDPHKDTKVRSLVIFYTLLLSKSSLLRRPLPAAVRWALATPIINLESPVARAVVVATAYRDTQENVVGFFVPATSRAQCVYIVRPCMRDIYLILREEKCGRQIRTATQSFRPPVPREFMHSPH